MFNRSRKKIIVSIMGPLILLFAVTMSVVLFASYREVRQNGAEMLERYVELYSPEKQTGEKKESEPIPEGQIDSRPKPDGQNDPKDKPLDERPDFQLSTFYSVALTDDGSVLAVDNGDKNVYSEEDLISIAKKLLSENRSSGRTENLSYRISHRPGYTLVAFMDNTVTESSLSLLLHNMLIIGGAALVILFFLSLILARKIIQPLEENDQKQKQFISDASHELKTPVAVINANAEMLSREIGDNEWLSNIQYENDRMGGLVKQLLDLSRAENTEIEMEQTDFSRVVIGESLAIESLAFDQGKTIKSDIDDGILLNGNQGQLAQLVSILLDNAIRHSTGEEIELSLKHQGHTAVLTVTNEGEDIPEEKKEHLFDRFYRIDESRNSKGHHYGLGLPIAKAVAEKHGGSITVSCRNGKVQFKVSIPSP